MEKDLIKIVFNLEEKEAETVKDFVQNEILKKRYEKNENHKPVQ